MTTFTFHFKATHGKWGKWSDYEACDVSCGGGKQHRKRLCNNPMPNNGGSLCQTAVGGKNLIEQQSKSCNTKRCQGKNLYICVTSGQTNCLIYNDIEYKCAHNKICARTHARTRARTRAHADTRARRHTGRHTHAHIHAQTGAQATCAGNMRRQHAQATCAGNMRRQHAQATCAGNMRRQHAQATCAGNMRRQHAQATCAGNMRRQHAQATCAGNMRRQHAQATCAGNMRNMRRQHAQATCAGNMRRTCAQHAQAARTCADRRAGRRTFMFNLEAHFLNPLTLVTPPLPPLPPHLQCGTNKIKDDDEIDPIVGGTDADRNMWIWQGGLYYNDVFICGGSLIYAGVFVTAAHCVLGRSKDLIVIRMGDHERYTTTHLIFLVYLSIYQFHPSVYLF